MDHTKLYLSTIDAQAPEAARQYDLGLEIADFCTPWNLDTAFPETDQAVRDKLKGISRRIFHGPFNELFPCAIDPRARELAAFRYRQAANLARNYGATRLVLHGGYNGRMYYPVWYTRQSIEFWKDFFREDPGIVIVLENVLEEEPGWLADIVKAVDHPNLRLCLDIGHVNAYSPVPVSQWIRDWAPWLVHFHIHNNDGSWDTHQPLFQGNLPIKEILLQAENLCPQATFTLELPEAGSSLTWLAENNLI